MADGAIIDIALVNGSVEVRGFDPFPQPAGAECLFLGRTREETHEMHGRLVRLSYEAYGPMAEKELRDLAHEAIEQFGVLAVRIHHAVGEVPPGEASVLVQVVTGHRDASFDACRFLIDALKVCVPIWKKEQWEDGVTWSEGSEETLGAGDVYQDEFSHAEAKRSS